MNNPHADASEHNTPLSQLVRRWETARAGGKAVTPQDLCPDRPDLQGDVARLLAALESLSPTSQSAIATPRVPVTAEVPSGGATPTGPRYRPVRAHARGGLGEVALAQDGELNRPGALKRMQPHVAGDAAARARFLREAEVTARLQHPGIVPVYGLTHDEEGRPVYAMRFVEGKSLQDA